MDACLGRILGLPAEGVMKYVKRHVAYVIRYKNKVQLLEQENRRLSEKKERIQGMVDLEINCGKVIITEVSSWLEEVVQMEGDIANFLQQENGESFKCFKGCMCPNLMWRHKMGKKADKWKSDVSELISRGDRLENSPVARNAPFRWEPQFDSSQYYTMFRSRALVFANIIEALKDSGIDLIGVHGPGGAGKTTMVKEVAKEAKKLGIFDKIVLAVVSNDPDTSKLQGDLLLQLDINYEQTSELGRADVLRKALLNGKRKILILLDDLWQVLDLNAIGIPISGPGDKVCKILLTSRRQDVFKGMGVHSTFSIGYLEEQEAWELFRKVTGDFGVKESIARKVSERCGGLPIAILAVGVALKGEEEVEWLNALRQLQIRPLKYIEGIDPMGYTPLKWSYNFLKDENAKSCFLLCCLFPEDAEISIDDLVRYSFALGFLRRVNTLKDARIEVQAMVNKLKRSCLLLNGEQENFVKMHDVIRDLAISITEEKQTEHDSGHDWPGQQQFMVDHNFRRLPRNDAWKSHTEISLRNSDGNFTFSALNCPLVHTLVLRLRGISYTEIPNDFFEGMKEARVLDLIGMFLKLPSSLLELNNLRMLSINHCYFEGDLKNQNLKNQNLEILSIVNSDGISTLPREIGELILLRSLDLRNCEILSIPKGVISKLINLEELYVPKSFKGWDTTIDLEGMSNASITELNSLTQLSVLHVHMSTESSKIMVLGCHDLFEKLTNFAININSHYGGNGFGNVLEISNIHCIDDKFHLLMDKVDDLKLHDIQDLRYLDGKPQLLQFTPSGGGSFCKLTYLSIDRCDNMKYLFSPSCAKAFQQLKKLHVRDCGRMEQIIGVGDHYNEEEVGIDEIIIFSRLTVMILQSLPQFRCFCPKMKKATIEENLLNSAESIFNEKVSFPVLEILNINQLPVKYLFSLSCAKAFQQLKELYVENCGRMEQIIGVGDHYNEEEVGIDEVIIFSRLTEMNLWSLPQCRCFCHKIIIFNRLTVMNLWSLPQFRCFYPKMKKATIEGNLLNSAESIFNEKISFPMLEVLKINQLPVKYLFSPSCVKAFQQLKELHIRNCGRMEQIIGVSDHYNEEEVGIDEVIIFTRLTLMILQSLPQFRCFCPKMKKATIEGNLLNSTESIFNEKVSFPMLEILQISQLPVKNIWNKETIQSSNASEGSFSQLKKVDISLCDNLVNLFPSRLQNLEILSVFACGSLTLLVEDLNVQSPTDKFEFNDVFPKLKDLNLLDLPKLIKIWLHDDNDNSNKSIDSYIKGIKVI